MTLGLTGERMNPALQWGDRNMREHYARYFFACTLVREGMRVLDVACGEGYGTQLLACAADGVTAIGVDKAVPVVEHASAKYLEPAYEVADIRALGSDWTRKFDLVVSFETIEHVAEIERALDELKRVVKPDGYVVLSTPNRGVYGPGNPYHERELTTDELADLLSMRFEWVDLYRQDWTEATVIRPLWHEERDRDSLVYGPMLDRIDRPPEEYVVAVCGAQPWRRLPARLVVT